MNAQVFRITRIEGEYAYLTPESGGEEIFIALALLPLGVDIGQMLSYENFEFTIAG